MCTRVQHMPACASSVKTLKQSAMDTEAAARLVGMTGAEEMNDLSLLGPPWT